MDFLFSRTYKYTVNLPIEKVLQDFSKVSNRKWTDYSANITGTLYDDNSFKFTHKWKLGNIIGIFGNDFASLKGTIKENSPYTIIQTTLRPNLALVFIAYFITGLFLCELFGIKTMIMGPKIDILLSLPFFVFLIVGLIFFMTNGLRNTFEKVFHLVVD